MEHRLTARRRGDPPRPGWVVYWMQASVRTRGNLALWAAHDEARRRGRPWAVVFCVDPHYPSANERSFAFLGDGLAEVARNLEALGASLVVVEGRPAQVWATLGPRTELTVLDRAYTPTPRRWRTEVAEAYPGSLLMADDNTAVVPEQASTRAEWSAATLRPRVLRQATLEPPLPQLTGSSVPDAGPEVAEVLAEAGFRLGDPHLGRRLFTGPGARWPVDPSVPATDLTGGEAEAWRRWEAFRDHGLERYHLDRSDPALGATSGLSPYLHFGHLSPASILDDLKARGLWTEPLTYRACGEGPVAKFLDELVVRRELAINAALHRPDFDRYEGLPEWCRRTLEAHRTDRRPWLGSRPEFEEARTPDPVWNAAQTELRTTGTIASHLRMYWGKKFLEWTADPAEGFAWALALNDRWALDGRGANGAAGVAWCFGLHDRPWGERPVWGLVRSMTAGGLRRKFDVDAYVRRFTAPS